MTRRGDKQTAQSCPNRACPHPLLLHDIAEDGPRVDHCTVLDCPCTAIRTATREEERAA